MQHLIKKVFAICLVASLIIASTSTGASADDTLERTFKDALYGGAIGALVGTAVLLLTDNPDEHWDYIATGAGVGVLGGAAYGLATSGLVQSSAATEVDEDGTFSLSMPTVKRSEIYDEKLNSKEVINAVDLFRLKF